MVGVRIPPSHAGTIETRAVLALASAALFAAAARVPPPPWPSERVSGVSVPLAQLVPHVGDIFAARPSCYRLRIQTCMAMFAQSLVALCACVVVRTQAHRQYMCFVWSLATSGSTCYGQCARCVNPSRFCEPAFVSRRVENDMPGASPQPGVGHNCEGRGQWHAATARPPPPPRRDVCESEGLSSIRSRPVWCDSVPLSLPRCWPL